MSLLDVALVGAAGAIWLVIVSPWVALLDSTAFLKGQLVAALRETLASAIATWLLGSALVLLAQQALARLVTRSATGWVWEVVSGLVMLVGFVALIASPAVQLLRTSYRHSQITETSSDIDTLVR